MHKEIKKNFRHEYKYLLNQKSYIGLREILKKLMSLDPHSVATGEYHIRSLYFDDMYNTAYTEKLLGIENRRKFRIRIYNYSDKTIKLEEKIKRNSYIKKLSSNISKEEFERIYDGDVTFLSDVKNQEQVKTDWYLEIRNKLLYPKVIVDYYREAYILPYNQIRITFDKNLAFAPRQKEIFNSNLTTFTVGQEYAYILEVKYNNFLPNYLRRILENYDLTNLAVSKYLLCRQHLKG